MSTAALDPVDLLGRLVAARSLSGAEGPAADVLADALRRAGAAVRRVGDNVIAEKGRGPRALLLNSHLDTVPPSDRWTRDPFTPAIDGDRLYGLGATDAKSCLAAMAAAFVATPDPGARGRLVFTATTEEETGGMGHPNGMETTLPLLGPLAGAVVGEPTGLDICNVQRGMVRLVLHAAGRAGHASRPWEGTNAIERAAEDIAALRTLAAELAGGDPTTPPPPGRVIPTIQPTLMTAGTAKNVIPDAAEVVLDVRTTPDCDNATLIARITAAVRSRVEVISQRFLPIATPPTAAVIRAARAALPQAAVRPAGGVSDLFFLATAPGGPVPGCLVGPGDGRQSHQPDEFVSLTMVRRAAVAYAALAERFWETPDDGH